MGTVWVACNTGSMPALPVTTTTSGREGDQFVRISTNLTRLATGPPDVDLHITALGPAQLLQRVHERSDVGLPVPVVRSRVQEHTDAPYSLALLRPCHKRPTRSCSAAEKRNELASLHFPP
jgi:hypothetical protein